MGRVAIVCIVTAAGLALALLVGDRIAGQRLPSCPEATDEATSYLAVGDFGKPPLPLEVIDPRASVARAIDEVYTEADPGPAGMAPEDAAEILLVAQWFRLHPDERRRMVKPERWLELKRPA